MASEDPYEYDDPYEDFSEDFEKPIGEKSKQGDSHAASPSPETPIPDLPAPIPGPSPAASPSGQVIQSHVQCSACGYNLTGVPIGGNCPECGASVNHSLYQSSVKPPSGKAITSMVLGICSVITCCCLGPVLGLIGLIFGILSLQELPPGPSANAPRGMAVAGIACSAAGILLGGGYWLMVIVG